MLRRRLCLVALALLSACAGPPAADPTPEAIAWIDAERDALEDHLGGWPPRFESDQERDRVMKRWSAALDRALAMSSTHANDPELLWRTGDLLRQGHNGHVEKAAPLADGILQKCLQLDPAHVGCHYTIARFYVASNPKFASQAEQHLLKARELVAPNVRPEFERFLAFAYFQQGRKTEALHTLDTYIALRPDDTDAVDFKRAIEEDRVKNHWVP